MIYLDSAATTLQKPPQVARAMAYAVSHMASPGRGGHAAAMAAADIAFACREAAGALFHVEDPARVIFTMNATHGLNIAIRSLVHPGDTVLISGYEHNAVTRALHDIPNLTVKVASAPLFEPEQMLAAFEAGMTDDVTCVICNHVSNVFGCIQPVEEIALLCQRSEIPLILDASQSAGILPVHMDRLRAAEEPVVLVTFGDHLPWMGDGNVFYDEMGMNVNASAEDGFYRRYTTRYLIWANDAAKAVIGHDVAGEGPAVSPCYLMDLVFDQLGWEGPGFMRAMDEMMEVFPIAATTGWTMTDGVLSGSVPEERLELYRRFQHLQYFWRNEFLYGDVMEARASG